MSSPIGVGCCDLFELVEDVCHQRGSEADRVGIQSNAELNRLGEVATNKVPADAADICDRSTDTAFEPRVRCSLSPFGVLPTKGVRRQHEQLGQDRIGFVVASCR